MSLKTEFRVGVTERQVAFGQDCKAIIPAPGIDGKFLALALKARSRQILAMVDEAGHGTGRLPTDLISKLTVKVPELPEQRGITEIIDSVDADISASRRVIRKLESVSSALISEHLNTIVTAAPDVMQLSSVTQVLSGVTLGSEPSGSGSMEVPYLRVANVQDGYVDTTEMKTIRILRSELPKYLLRAGDVLLTEGGDLDKLGRGTMWDARITECICQNHIFRVRCNEAVVLPAYLALYIGSPIGKSYFLKIAKQTTNLASINSTQLKQMPLPIPSLEDQASLIELMASSTARIGAERQRFTQLRKLKQGLLDDLLMGRVPVPAR